MTRKERELLKNIEGILREAGAFLSKSLLKPTNNIFLIVRNSARVVTKQFQSTSIVHFTSFSSSSLLGILSNDDRAKRPRLLISYAHLGLLAELVLCVSAVGEEHNVPLMFDRQSSMKWDRGRGRYRIKNEGTE